MKMANMDDYFDVVIVGTGAAGLYCALNLPARYRILLLTKQKADESDSFLAQGGICMLRGEEDFDAGIAKLREQYNIPLIMLSLGRDGSRAYYKDLRVEVKPFLQDSTIETTGAGDTFGGCCLHHVLKYGLDNLDEEKLTEMLTFANAAASIVTTRKGALRVMPEVEEVEAFIKSRA